MKSLDQASDHHTAETPRDPHTWIITTARTASAMPYLPRHTRVPGLSVPEDARPSTERGATRDDDTLALMLACAHPASDRSVHTPLRLQVVIGVRTPT
ncbi:MAG: hypothetical protein ACTH31_04965, partial [Pseudoclavibacter sp.]